MRQQFFDSISGLTSTSANHIANLAKEYIQTLKTHISRLNYIREETKAGGNTYETRLPTKEDEVKNLESKIIEIAQATQLIAWLREAIKEKQSVKVPSFESWYLQTRGEQFPSEPTRRDIITTSEIISGWDINKYNAYLTAETYATVYGEMIHPNGSISNARKELAEAIANPVSVEGTGRDLMVTKYIPMFLQERIDNNFFALQAKQREYQAKCNSYVYEIEQQIQKDTDEANSQYNVAYNEWRTLHKAAFAEYQKFSDSEKARINNLKIAVPDALLDIFHKVSGLGKQ